VIPPPSELFKKEKAKADPAKNEDSLKPPDKSDKVIKKIKKDPHFNRSMHPP
jgi:hypothetical protein